MADLDLTAAVEAAARALYEDAYPGATYTHADHERCLESDYAAWPSRARVAVAAAAPVIAAQARREALTELAERLRGAERDCAAAEPGEDQRRLGKGLRLALRIKADGIRLAITYIEEALR